ncbi:hypothetical protein F2Q68_00046180 [Brassica cretica]|uniref:Protein kinase domain-containing protein n=1 Tax=Brassica cretica TaxID=69181 RepID=A0A8S9LS85_BRACR|nr:hypothetical protein F2Q68_00046180 [Brassica cretica]
MEPKATNKTCCTSSLGLSLPHGKLTRLDRLQRLSLSDNDLSGSIPADLSRFGENGFAGNNRLCGKPLSTCGTLNGKNVTVIVIAGVTGAVGSLCVGFAVFWWFFIREARRKNGYGAGESKDDGDWIGVLKSHKLVQVALFQKPIVKIRLVDLIVATDSFGSDNVLVSSRTGVSYKADLPDGSALEVKKLSCGYEVGEKQFRLEMNRLGQIRHPNLVPLLGFCVVEDERLLVYKHMANGTLNSRLQGLDWPGRVRISVGAARGLAWLHHGCEHAYLHQYISSNVILLDEDYDARVIDYGLGKLVSSTRDSNDSSFSNGDFGEVGYVAPEYASTMVASLSGDVYAFGVVLLEIVTGQKPLSINNGEDGFNGSLVDWVNRHLSDGRGKDVVDRCVIGKGYDDEMMQFLRIACSCVVTRPKERPLMKVSKRAKKASRRVLPAAMSPRLVSFAVDGILLLGSLSITRAFLEVICSIGGTVFTVILLIRLFWTGASFFQNDGNSFGPNPL